MLMENVEHHAEEEEEAKAVSQGTQSSWMPAFSINWVKSSKRRKNKQLRKA